MEKIVFADHIIAKNAAAKIAANDVVLVYGRASGVEAGILHAHKEGTPFRGTCSAGAWGLGVGGWGLGVRGLGVGGWGVEYKGSGMWVGVGGEV